MISKRALIIKLIYAVIMPIGCHIALNLINSLFALIVFVAIGILYYIPFSLNSFVIKRDALSDAKSVQLKSYILSDLLFVTLPSIVSVVLTEVIFSFFSDATGDGVVSVVLCLMFILITLFGWLTYVIKKKTANLAKRFKKPERK